MRRQLLSVLTDSHTCLPYHPLPARDTCSLHFTPPHSTSSYSVSASHSKPILANPKTNTHYGHPKQPRHPHNLTPSPPLPLRPLLHRIFQVTCVWSEERRANWLRTAALRGACRTETAPSPQNTTSQNTQARTKTEVLVRQKARTLAVGLRYPIPPRTERRPSGEGFTAVRGLDGISPPSTQLLWY